MATHGISNLDRREFLLASGLGGPALAASAATVGPSQRPETLVSQLHDSLSAEQRETVVLPFDSPLRSRIENNWHITDARVGRFFSRDQQALIHEIFVDLHAPEFHKSLGRHIVDDFGSVNNLSVALFGEPKSGKFEFVITGRHCTARCDGDSVEGAAFGGPIFYGHEGESFYEKPTHPGNVYWFQALRANEVFQALDGRQRSLALRPRAPRERSVHTVEPSANPDGLPVSEMTSDQRGLVGDTLGDLLLPFRESDRREAMKLLDQAGGLENLRMAFYENEDLGNDGIWDVWKLESPTMVWYFRGAPHVHVWVNIQENPGWTAPEGATRRGLFGGGGRRRGRRRARA